MQMSRREIAEQVVKYCDLNNIPCKDGEVGEEYASEIEAFIISIKRRDIRDFKREKKIENQHIARIVNKVLKGIK